ETIPITFTPSERSFYDELEQLGKEANHFTLLTLKREICSSREAVFITLKKMIERAEIEGHHLPKAKELLEKTSFIDGHAKAEKALELIKQTNDKVIIFTEYRATQLFLQWFLHKNGISSVPFRGGRSEERRVGKGFMIG